MLNLLALKDYQDIMSISKRHIFDLFPILEEEYNFKIININELYKDECKDNLITKFGKVPDNIIILDGSSTIYKMKLPKESKVSIIIDDIHHMGSIKKYRKKSLKFVTNIFSTYGYFFRNQYDTTAKVFFFPHSIRFDCEFNNKPIRKILISGRLNENIYPNRQKMYNISLKNRRLLYLKPNVGYREKVTNLTNDKIHGQKFINYMNRFLCCFTCDASHNRPYIVAKHFEILSSGSLLLSCNENTKKYFDLLGFEDNIHYISCTKDTIEEKINFILSLKNLQKINEIRKNGYTFARKHHYYKNRAKYINDIINNKNNDKIIQVSNEYGIFEYMKVEDNSFF
ncbi:MAG: hypothetical protein CMF62_01560 [Magnetococcales bacterium]|nr:hypothetical protein [Magnetococcales bacterium]|tara:strand:- start:43440 stop:44462 length:1023 start_codon:yes stop_codon:yes gene_type:complete